MNAQLLKEKRKELNLTQQQLADKCGLSVNTIYNYERNKVTATIENLKKIANILDIDYMDLMVSDKEKNDFIFKDGDINFSDSVIENMRKNLIYIVYSEILKYNSLIEKNISEKEKIRFENLSSSIIDTFENLTEFKFFYSSYLKKVVFINLDKKVLDTIDRDIFLFSITSTLNTLKSFLELSNKDITLKKNIVASKYKIVLSELNFLGSQEKNKEGGSDE